MKETINVLDPGIEYKTLKDLYLEWIVPNVESIKKTLMDTYGEERFDFQVTKIPRFLEWLEKNDQKDTKANQEFFTKCKKGSSVISDFRRNTAYTILIHYPELTVKNSKGRSRKITDMYIKIELSPFLTDATGSYQLFRGQRTSFTYAEFSSHYDFSHLSNQPKNSDFGDFCLGSTDFSLLCKTCAIEFNQNLFSLFCYQLEAYLSWESIEGGPYKYLNDVHEKGDNYTSVNIDNSTIIQYYKEYLKSGHIPNTELKSNDFYHVFVVMEDDSLRDAITKVVTNDNHLQFWDGARKMYNDRQISGRSAQIERALSEYGNERFKFKGKSMRLEFTDKEEKKEEKDDNKKVAHQIIVRYIVEKLNASLLNNVKNGFKKGINITK